MDSGKNERQQLGPLTDWELTAINLLLYLNPIEEFDVEASGKNMVTLSVTYAKDGVGKFPDAPTCRGRKHLKELAKLTILGYRASVVFIAQREDAEYFMPFTEIDPDFTETLRQVYREGVEVHAYRCDVSTE